MNISTGMCDEPPTPLEPKVYLPGSAFASAMNSGRFLRGSFGIDHDHEREIASPARPGEIRDRIVGRLLVHERHRGVARADEQERVAVGFGLCDRARRDEPPPPPMFSISTRCGSCWLSRSARMRAIRSTPPPAATWTTNLIGRSGQLGGCPVAGPTTAAPRVRVHASGRPPRISAWKAACAATLSSKPPCNGGSDRARRRGALTAYFSGTRNARARRRRASSWSEHCPSS